MNWKAELKDAVAHARRLEQSAAKLPGLRPIMGVALMSLIRQRRLAEAVGLVDARHGFEARILVRSMLEIHFNLAWMGLRRRNQRASRFVKFRAIEMLKLMEDAPTSFRTASTLAAEKRFKAARRSARHLFRHLDHKGRRYWARDWAEGSSFEQRMLAVLKVSRTASSPPERFMYMIYRWFSGAVHGSPHSMNGLVERIGASLRQKPDEQLETDTSLRAATIVLGSTSMLAGYLLELPAELRDASKARFEALKLEILADSGAAA